MKCPPLRLRAPGSKSMTQRGLIIGALAGGPVELPGALECDDSLALTGLLEALGPTVRWDRRGARVHPRRFVPRAVSQSLGNAGTAVRFGACLSLLHDREITVDGDARMRHRPIGELAEALRGLGVQAIHTQRDGYPPLKLHRVEPPPIEASIDVSRSSQFASGLLLVAPRLEQGLHLSLKGDIVSAPYLRMTTEMMRRAGATVRWPSERWIVVLPGGYPALASGGRLPVEPDWSGAAFLLAAGFVAGIPVEVEGLLPPGESVQGDAVFLDHLRRLSLPADSGPGQIDLKDAPDLIAPLAAAALFAEAPTRISGVAHARIKESDRIEVLARGFRAVGAQVQEHDDGLTLHPLDLAQARPASLDPEGDHRMAMAFGLLQLAGVPVRIDDPGCVSKSFPGFWEVLEQVRRAAR